MKRAELPDGTVLEFPDDTPDAVMDKAVRGHLSAPAPAPKDTRPKSFWQGAKEGAADVAYSVARKAEMAADAMGVREPLERFGKFINPGGYTEGGVNVARNAFAQRQQAAPYAPSGAGRLTGAIAASTPTLLIPGGALAQGAASGALLSDRETAAGIGTDALIGGVAGKAGEKILNALSYAATPVVGKANQMLNEAGVPQTIGQIARGGKSWTAKALAAGEDALTSVPFIGDMVNAARARGVDGFNKAIADRALSNIKEAVPKDIEPGIEMVDFVGDRLSAKYQQLVPKLSGAFDKAFQKDLADAKQLTSVLPEARQEQFAAIVHDVFANRAKGPRISGQELKDAESRLTTLIKKYAKSTDADQNIMADALEAVRGALRGSVMRSNPQHAAELQALNKGWAQLATFKAAANAPGNATGVVTPAQMLAAARRSGFRDELVRAGKEVLPSEVPDSGTARRTFSSLLAGGALGSHFVGPAAMAPAAASSLYTKPGQDLLNAFVFGTRPKALQGVAKVSNALAKVAPAAAPALTAQRSK